MLTAIISIILGMGMPTVSVYVLTATLLAPSLIKLGVTPMAAHMYVMYFGMLIDDHAAGGDRGLCRRQYRAGVGLDHRLDRGGGRLEHVLHPVPVRARTEPADGRTARA